MSVWILCNLCFRGLWAAWYGCLVLNLSPLKEQNVILASEPSLWLQLPKTFFKIFLFIFFSVGFWYSFFGAVSFFVSSTVLELVCKPTSLEFIEIFLFLPCTCWDKRCGPPDPFLVMFIFKVIVSKHYHSVILFIKVP